MNAELLQRWRDCVHSNHQSENTRREYFNNPMVMLRTINKPYDEIAQNDLNKYVQFCFKTYKRNTLSLKFWAINNFIKWMERKDLSLPNVNPVDAGKTALNKEEMDKIFNIIEQLSPLHRLTFYLVYDAIRRPQEISILMVPISDKWMWQISEQTLAISHRIQIFSLVP